MVASIRRGLVNEPTQHAMTVAPAARPGGEELRPFGAAAVEGVAVDVTLDARHTAGGGVLPHGPLPARIAFVGLRRDAAASSGRSWRMPQAGKITLRRSGVEDMCYRRLALGLQARAGAARNAPRVLYGFLRRAINNAGAV